MTAIHLEGLPLYAPHNDTETSREAAERVLPKVATQLAQVYAVVRVGNGMTEREIETVTGLPGNSVRPRLWTLQGKGPGNPPVLIRVAGKRDGRNVYVVNREAA